MVIQKSEYWTYNKFNIKKYLLNNIDDINNDKRLFWICMANRLWLENKSEINEIIEIAKQHGIDIPNTRYVNMIKKNDIISKLNLEELKKESYEFIRIKKSKRAVFI